MPYPDFFIFLCKYVFFFPLCKKAQNKIKKLIFSQKEE